MTHRPIFVLLFGLFIIPQVAFGAVRISEIAWMGNADSAANEWIELSNDGEDTVNLSLWTLGSTDGSPLITLDGTVSAGGYFLIERTDDDSVSGVSASLIASFGNGLSNTGETLQLKDTSGAVVDEVIGTDEWANIGGDNTTKATAQRTASGWITATPTPKSANASTPQQAPQTQQTPAAASTTSGAVSQSGSSAPSPSPYPRANISAIAPEDVRAYIGAPALFSGNSKGLFDEELPYATYHWNFGDGTVATGKSVEHIYQNAGNYLAVLEVSWAGKHTTDRMKVSVVRAEAVIVSVATTSDGVILIKNVSSRELDLSGWSLGSASSTFFVFPANSIILPSESLPLPIGVTRVSPNADLLELRYVNGNVASSFARPGREKQVSFVKNIQSGGMVLGASVSQEVKTEKVYGEKVATEQSASVALSLGNTDLAQKFLSPWTMLFGTLMLLGIVTTLYIRRLRPVPEAETYSITEDDAR